MPFETFADFNAYKKSSDSSLLSDDDLRAKLSDYETFANKLLKVSPPFGNSRVSFDFNQAQRDLDNRLTRELKQFGRIRALVPKARKMGVSTYVGGRYYHRCITKKGRRAIIVAHRSESSAKLFADVKSFHNGIPLEWRSSTSYSNARELVFDCMDSLYKVSVASGEAIGRSDTFQLMHLSEAAFFADAADLSSGLLNAIYDADDTEVIIESTGNGQSGMFYEMCQEAQKQNNEGAWRVHFLPWTLFPFYRATEAHIPRNWSPPTEFRQYATMYRLDPAQLYWYWQKNGSIASMNGGTSDEIHKLTRQEYPIVVSECFLADSTFDFFPPSKVAEAMAAMPRASPGSPKILAADPAIDGDETFVADREGGTIGAKVWGSLATPDPNVQADWMVATIGRFGFDIVVIDATGVGQALVSALRLRLPSEFPIVAVQFGGHAVLKPLEYGNRRAEIHDRLRQFFLASDGRSIPNDGKLSEELAQFKWGTNACRRDDQGRMFVTKKEIVRAALGRSPDRTDAAALTLAVEDSVMDVSRGRKGIPIR